ALIKQIEALNFQRPILISSSPLIADVIGSINETSSHYICLDDWGEFEGAFRCLNEVEQELLKKVDSCFAVSETLLTERKSAKGENHFLPQGVDVDHFSKSEDSVPPELRSLPKPIIGYFGLFATYVNFEMIIESARAYPTASVVLFGRTKTDISRLLEEPNIHFLGEIPFSNLPRYASAFDVGLIPFTVNKLTIAANPLKLLEYLSLGIPVVSTELPEVMKFQDVVFIAKDTNDFVRCVGKALAEDTLEQNERRRNQAEKFSWRAIVEEFSNIVLRIEETKNSIRSS
ncbi:MAG: glycosyltransferase family 1 protein, partial [Bacteroidetes bacterium]